MGAHFGPDDKPVEIKPETKTQKLLRQLGLRDGFADPTLPKGTFSHSQYNSFKICARAYAYKYVEGIKTPAYVATSRGSSVHKAIEFALKRKMDLGKPPTIDEARAVASDVFDKESANIENWEENEPGKVKDSTIALYDVFHREALARINPIAIEKGFAVKVGDVPMIGYIDVIDEQPAIAVPGLDPETEALGPKKLVTVDFKTSRARWSKADLDLDTQLTLYAAVEGTPHVRIDQLIQLKSKGAIYVRGESTRTPTDAAILTEDIQQTANYVRQGIFPMCEISHWACNASHCSFYSLCRGRKR